VQFFEIFLK